MNQAFLTHKGVLCVRCTPIPSALGVLRSAGMYVDERRVKVTVGDRERQRLCDGYMD